MEGENRGSRTTVCVTGASGFIGSWLVMRLLERGYFVRATVRDPANANKVKHLLDLPKAETHLSLWKADLLEEGSFDDAIQGCAGVFHVATPMKLSFNDLEMYFVAKTMAEKAAWEFAKENGLDLVTIHPSIVIGPFITPSRPLSVDLSLSVITRNEALFPMVTRARAVHVDDVCNAHIYLFENPKAEGRYICSSHCFTILDLAKSLSRRYPEYNIPIKFDGVDESLKPVPCSSKKLMDLGFKFKYSPEEHDVGDLVAEAIESCREKGLMPV